MARFIQSTEIETKHEESNGVTRRGFLRLVLAGSGLFAGAAASRAFAAKPVFAATAAANDYPKQLKIAHLTDIHYFSPKLYSDCPDFTLAENSDRKMFKESAAIADKALADIVADQPDLIVVSGDLTKDGKQVCHQEIHDKIVAAQQQLKQAGKGTKVYVINGNHDINNNANGRDFSSGSAQPTPSATPAWFKDLWRDQCYNDDVVMYDAGGQDGGSLSYVARPCKGLTFIVVDSGKYSADQTASGQAEHETSGMISQRLLDWVCNQAKQAKAAGDVVIAMQHHGVVPHFGMEPEVLGEYLVDDYANVANAYADAGISCVFTGHMHANDIASVKSPAGNTIYDVETCATVTYPSDIRFSTLTWGRDAKDPRQVTATLELHSHALGAVAYGKYAETYKGAADIADITAYGNDHLLTPDVVKTMVGDALVAPYLQQFATTGSKVAIAGLVGVEPEQLDGQIFNLVAGLLPTSKEAGMIIDWSSLNSLLKSYGNAAVWFDASAAKIMIERTEDAPTASRAAAPMSLELTPEAAGELEAAAAATPMAAASSYSLYISAETLSKFLSKVYQNLDEKVLTDPAAVVAIVKQLVDTLMIAKVTDSEHTVFDLVKYAYGDHLRGDETCETWAETAIANSAKDGSTAGDGSVIGLVRAAINSVVVGNGSDDTDLIVLLKKVRFTLSDLVASNDGGSGKGPFTLIGLVVSSVGALLGYLGDDPAALIPNIPSVAQLAYNTLYTLTHDDNTPADRDFTLSAAAIDPDYKPEDNGGNGGTTDGGSNDSDNRGDGTQSGGNHNGTGADTKNNSASSDKKPSANGSKKAARLPQTGDISMATVAATAAIGAAAVGAGTWKALHHDEEEDNSLSK